MLAGLQPTMDTYHAILGDLFWQLYKPNERRSDFLTRQIICTVCDGAYGFPAYVAFVVTGTPPRGAIMYAADETTSTFIDNGRARRLGDAQHRVVRDCAKGIFPKLNGRLSADQPVVRLGERPVV